MDGERIGVEVLKDTRAILLSGEPISEKVVSQGPFVMNNETQILQAMRDYQMGKMGMLVEEFSYNPVADFELDKLIFIHPYKNY